MPGQVAALRRRLELLVPTQERLTAEIATMQKQAVKVPTDDATRQAAERASRRVGRLRHELATLDREMQTLQSLVNARLGLRTT
jgi:signal transduction histidine kinase